MVELVIAERAHITHAERPMTLPELVLEVGSLVSVTYRLESGRRIADAVTIEAPAGSAPPPSAASDPTPQA